jgi:hypothetical protein
MSDPLGPVVITAREIYDQLVRLTDGIGTMATRMAQMTDALRGIQQHVSLSFGVLFHHVSLTTVQSVGWKDTDRPVGCQPSGRSFWDNRTRRTRQKSLSTGTVKTSAQARDSVFEPRVAWSGSGSCEAHARPAEALRGWPERIRPSGLWSSPQ